MRELILDEMEIVTGAGGIFDKVNLGTIVSTLAIGIITGGPAGLGIAVSGLVLAQGVDNLNDLFHQK